MSGGGGAVQSLKVGLDDTGLGVPLADLRLEDGLVVASRLLVDMGPLRGVCIAEEYLLQVVDRLIILTEETSPTIVTIQHQRLILVEVSSIRLKLLLHTPHANILRGVVRVEDIMLDGLVAHLVAIGLVGQSLFFGGASPPRTVVFLRKTETEVGGVVQLLEDVVGLGVLVDLGVGGTVLPLSAELVDLVDSFIDYFSLLDYAYIGVIHLADLLEVLRVVLETDVALWLGVPPP